MAITDQTSDIIAQLTDNARTLIARATLGDAVFQVVGFSLGRSGFDPSNIVAPTPIVTTDAELTDKVYPDATPLTYAEFSSVEEPTGTVRVYNCRVGADTIPGNADYALGELGLYGKILNSSVSAEIGTIFLYAISHFPVSCKTTSTTYLRRVVISY